MGRCKPGDTCPEDSCVLRMVKDEKKQTPEKIATTAFEIIRTTLPVIPCILSVIAVMEICVLSLHPASVASSAI